MCSIVRFLSQIRFELKTYFLMIYFFCFMNREGRFLFIRKIFKVLLRFRLIKIMKSANIWIYRNKGWQRSTNHNIFIPTFLKTTISCTVFWTFRQLLNIFYSMKSQSFDIQTFVKMLALQEINGFSHKIVGINEL